jgi:branched-chain amino acid transport system permease protein
MRRAGSASCARTLSARHVLAYPGAAVLPFVATPFLPSRVAAQALVLGLIALSLTFLGGYGGIVSLAQMSAWPAWRATRLPSFGASSTPISLGWLVVVAVPFALVIATAVRPR